MKLRSDTRSKPRGDAGRSNGKPPRRGRIGTRIGYRARSFGLALLLALVAVLVTNAYVDRYKRNVERAAATVPVLVATRDIPLGTSGAEIVGGDFLAERQVARRDVVPGAIDSEAQIEELVASQTIFAGEQVTARTFEPAEERGVRGDIDGTMRAIAVTGEENQILAGRLADGDRVDVVATLELGGETAGGGAQVGSSLILRDLLVLDAAGTSEGEESPGAGKRPAVVLALTDAEVRKLFFAMKYGEWALVLRPSDAADGEDAVDTAVTVLGLRSRGGAP